MNFQYYIIYLKSPLPAKVSGHIFPDSGLGS